MEEEVRLPGRILPLQTDFEPIVCQLSSEAIDDIEEIERNSNQIPWSKKLLLEQFSNSHSRFYGVRSFGALLGFILVQSYLDEAHVLSFGIRSEYRSRGFGRALMVELLHTLYHEGVRSIYLEVRRSNEAARHLYTTLGFSEVSERSHYYHDNGEDAIVMSLWLSEFVTRDAGLAEPIASE